MTVAPALASCLGVAHPKPFASATPLQNTKITDRDQGTDSDRILLSISFMVEKGAVTMALKVSFDHLRTRQKQTIFVMTELRTKPMKFKARQVVHARFSEDKHGNIDSNPNQR